MFEIQNDQAAGPVIKVVGVGGAGGNAVDHMIEKGIGKVEFIAVNTDAQVLARNRARNQIQLGTSGLGAGAKPEEARTVAHAERERLQEAISGSHMVFITAGMGGGTGTGAAPVVAEIARDVGALTVGVVTKPFSFEGPRRARLAEEGIAMLKTRVDTSIVIPNDRLFNNPERRVRLVDAFRMADAVLSQGVQGVSDIILIPGLINVDFADVKAIMTNAGTAIMGIGSASGDSRAAEAASRAIASPLLESTIEGARGVLVNITAGSDFTLDEFSEASTVIQRATDEEDAFIIIGCVLDETLGEEVRVTVIATGFPGGGGGAQIGSFPEARIAAPPGRTAQPTRSGPVTSPSTPHAQQPTSQAPAQPPAAQPQQGADWDVPPFLRNSGRR